MTTRSRPETGAPPSGGLTALPTVVIGAAHPLTGGVAPFNEAMVRAMRRRGGQTLFLGWDRMYPPLLHRGQSLAGEDAPPGHEPAERLLDWHDPRTWRRAMGRVEELGAKVLVLPWLHPVMTPPYRWLLRNAPKDVCKVVICHNVELHERVPLARGLTRSVLRQADLLVTHAPQQRAEIEALGLGATPILETFLPMLVAEDLAAEPSPAAVAAERARLGDPALSLLVYGAVRPYKGVDIAVEAMRHLPPTLDVRLVIAGRFWGGSEGLRARAAELGLQGRVEIHDGYQSNDETALRFAASDVVVLPYRSATQSGVVSLAFAYGRPVVATAVGGLPQSVRDGVDGLLCAPEDPQALAEAITRLAADPLRFADGVEETRRAKSFDRYAELIDTAARR